MSLEQPEPLLQAAGFDQVPKEDCEPSRARVGSERMERQLPPGFLKLVAHELRSPLTTLRLALQLALGRLQRGESVEPRTLQKALVQVDEMCATITELCDAGNVASDDGQYELTALDCVEMLEQETELFVDDYSTHRLLFDRTVASATVRGDRRRLGQVVRSLLDNAAKFSPSGTAIRVSVAVREQKVELAVADEGIGIPGPEHDEVFEMFRRASNASNLSTKGLGLGLFISREIVERHGGRIWFESDTASGSTFYVALPIWDPSPSKDGLV
jgi:two-component system, OmpR family, sensor histidine kinase VicK